MTSNTVLQPWKVLTTQIVHATPWIEVIADTCVVEQQQFIYTYTRRIDEGPLIIAEQNNKLWFVRQYRHPIKKIIWQFPIEGKEAGESWETAAQRGIAEELGLFSRSLTDLGVFYPDPGGLAQTYRAYLAEDLEPIKAVVTHKSTEEIEKIETGCFSRTEIDNLINSGEICDNWTLSGLFLYDRYKTVERNR